MKIAIKKNSYKNIIKIILKCVMFYVLSISSLNYEAVKPFDFGLFYALMFLDDHIFETAISFFVAYNLANLSVLGVFVSLNLIIVPLVFKLVHNRLNKKVPIILILIYAILGNITKIYFNCYDAKICALTLISVLIGEVFLFACYYFLKANKFNYVKRKLNLDELICGACLLIAFGMGLSSINLFEFDKLIGVFIILCCANIYSNETTLIIATLLGIGSASHFLNAGIIAVYVCFGLCAIVFKSNYKLLSCVAILLVDIVFGLCFLVFEDYTIYSLVAIILGELIYILIPNKTFYKIKNLFGTKSNNLAVKEMINKSKENISKRMLEIANVFLEMNSVYKQMVVGQLSIENAKRLLKQDLFDKCCKDCGNNCSNKNEKILNEIIDNLIDLGFEKGKITLLDVPSYLTSNCNRINYLIGTLNSLLKTYKHYAIMVENMDSAKILIADQLKGIANLIEKMTTEIKENVSFNFELETKIKEELSYKNVVCLDAVVFTEELNSITNVDLIVYENQFDKKKFEKFISKIIAKKVKLTKQCSGEIEGTINISFKTAPKYDLVFGSAKCSKNGVDLSGDTYSTIKIDDSKYMIALCDGMGSGERANKTSNLTITLIENFYKAGFENETILNSVNKLLSLNSKEDFSALDVLVIDTRKEIYNFIKLGAPYGFVKHQTETEIIETCGLPIGVLDEMQPHITKKNFSAYDVIILVSDGISEAFQEKEKLQNFINNLTSTNPQTIADEILEKAISLVNGNCNDDFTCVAVRIFELI